MDKEEYIYAGIPTFMGGKFIEENHLEEIGNGAGQKG